MNYPSMPDIISSIKVPQLIKDPVLSGASIQINKSGIPIMYVGGFSMVFPMSKGKEKWAMKVWYTEIKDIKERYKIISKFLNSKNNNYFANFSYVENGLLVNGQLLDTIRMRWIEGKLLKDFLNENLNNKLVLNKFANNFLSLAQELHSQTISHGDLQHGNIIVQNNGDIKLVDYDTICVPETEGKKEFVTGLKGYQHPSRFTNSICSIKADYFSELVIYLSVLAIVENPDLWNKYKVIDTETLLFNQEDFQNFKQSDIRKDLLKLSNKITYLVNILEEYLKEKNYINLIPFESYLSGKSYLPESDKPTSTSGSGKYKPAMNTSIRIRNIIIGIELLLIFLLIWFYYCCNKKYNSLESELQILVSQKYKVKSSLDSTLNLNEQLRDDISDQNSKIIVLANEKEDLQTIIGNKTNSIDSLNEEIRKYKSTIAKIQASGLPMETQQYLAELNQEINKLTSEKANIEAERDKNVQEINNLKNELQISETELYHLKNTQIPNLENKVNELNQELNIQHRINAIANIRGEIADLKLDYSDNAITFSLSLSFEDIAILKTLGIQELTFSPIVENLSSSPFFQIYINESIDQSFRKNVFDLDNVSKFKIKLLSPNLKSVYKNKNALNFDSGDLIKLEIRINELDKFSIAQSSFRIKK